MRFQSLKGVKDILPREAEKYNFLAEKAEEIFSLYGFQEIKIPLIEKKELFIRSIGEETDIVAKEIYSLIDPGGEKIALRPEGTASVVRAYLENQLYNNSPLIKLYYLGPMFRAEKPQAGRFRQFYQLGAEVFGTQNPQMDAEILLMLNKYLKSLGLEKFRLELNSVGCEKCRPLHRQALKNFLEPCLSSLCPNCNQRFIRNPLRIFDCKNKSCAEFAAKAPKSIDYLCSGCEDHFNQLIEYLKGTGFLYHLNPRLVRGLDYYTKTAFEITSDKLGAQNALGGGGRFDNLVKEMGGPDKPALGFALGLERIVSLLKQKNLPPRSERRVFIACLGVKAVRLSFKLIQQFRDKKITVERDYETGSLKSQLRKANRYQAEYVLILAENELANNACILRDMKNSVQEEIGLGEVVELVSQRLAAG